MALLSPAAANSVPNLSAYPPPAAAERSQGPSTFGSARTCLPAAHFDHSLPCAVVDSCSAGGRWALQRLSQAPHGVVFAVPHDGGVREGGQGPAVSKERLHHGGGWGTWKPGGRIGKAPKASASSCMYCTSFAEAATGGPGL